MYYTLRKTELLASSTIYELSKWEEFEVLPAVTYRMQLVQTISGPSFYGCNCPSRSQPCKHWGIARALLDHPHAAEGLHLLTWQEGNVKIGHDFYLGGDTND